MFGIDDALLGAGLQAGGSILGGIMGGNAAGDAAKAQSEAAGAARTTLRNAMVPYRSYQNTGVAANDRLTTLLGLNGNFPITPELRAWAEGPKTQQIREQYGIPADAVWTPTDDMIRSWASDSNAPPEVQASIAAAKADNGALMRKFSQGDLEADPVYQNGLKFGLDQGTSAVNNRAVANGGYDSGATLKALTRFANDYGTTKAEGAYNRFNTDKTNTYNMLSGQQSMGLQANAPGVQGANQIAGLQTDQGNAQAAGIVGQANAASNAFGGIGTAIQGYQNNQILNKLLNRGGASSYGGSSSWGLNGGAFNPDN